MFGSFNGRRIVTVDKLADVRAPVMEMGVEENGSSTSLAKYDYLFDQDTGEDTADSYGVI